MFSQTVEYALRAMVYLAQNSETPNKTSEISVGTKVPAPYLTKVLQSLQRAGLVRCQRGIGGGIRLEKSPDETSILEVVDAVEPIVRIESCPLELKSHGKRLCSLHRKMDQVGADTEKAFRTTTLQELIKDRNPSKPLRG
jgi:Rrf2 family transcriptional regulator, nitric oxide-sensitive transcriptional repressor